MFEAKDRRDNLPVICAEHADTEKWMEQKALTIRDRHGGEIVERKYTLTLLCAQIVN